MLLNDGRAYLDRRLGELRLDGGGNYDVGVSGHSSLPKNFIGFVEN